MENEDNEKLNIILSLMDDFEKKLINNLHDTNISEPLLDYLANNKPPAINSMDIRSFGKLIEELSKLPPELIDRIYEIVKKINLHITEGKEVNMPDFAGAWKDISDEDFNNFLQVIEKGRERSLRRDVE